MDAKKVSVLVTGGAGYIGSHAVVKLLENGNMVVVVDNLSNSYKAKDKTVPESLLRAQEITGRRLMFLSVDLLNLKALESVFSMCQFDCVMHFAALKAVGESCQKPLQYYRNNVVGTLNLLDVMNRAGCRRLIYSSSATVYGDPTALPLFEGSPTGSVTNPYGGTKHTTEMIMSDLCASDPRWKIVSLRYFNPVGAHESGRMGEDPNGIPNNLMPYIAQVAVGKLKELKVYGNNYNTRDGTGVRDYIHIQDLADGHLKALEKIFEIKFAGYRVYNLGTGQGYSVLEMIRAFKKASGKEIPFTIVERRPGDIAECYCNCFLAKNELKWKAKKTLEDMCKDIWRWQQMNPNGYSGTNDKSCKEQSKHRMSDEENMPDLSKEENKHGSTYEKESNNCSHKEHRFVEQSQSSFEEENKYKCPDEDLLHNNSDVPSKSNSSDVKNISACHEEQLHHRCDDKCRCSCSLLKNILDNPDELIKHNPYSC